jgi:phosphoribosylaminoimidazole-succinocarboxamide synthase
MAIVERLEQLYEGKAKKVYRTNDPALCIIEFKDDATAFNGLKKGTIEDKGILNNLISSRFFQLLQEKGISSHFVERLSDREMLAQILEIIPIEVVVRNVVAGSLAKRLGLDEGVVFDSPVLEFYYKRDDLGDPLINEYVAFALKLATPEQLAKITDLALKINQVLREFLKSRNIELVDFKLEFGLHLGEVLLGDEISPDTCRFWDLVSKEKLDKDRFRRDLGQVEEAYAEIWRRIQD